MTAIDADHSIAAGLNRQRLYQFVALVSLVLGLVLTPGPAPHQCGSDADCATFGVVVCALCPDYTGGTP